jgi:hypothetical protein
VCWLWRCATARIHEVRQVQGCLKTKRKELRRPPVCSGEVQPVQRPTRHGWASLRSVLRCGQKLSKSPRGGNEEPRESRAESAPTAVFDRRPREADVMNASPRNSSTVMCGGGRAWPPIYASAAESPPPQESTVLIAGFSLLPVKPPAPVRTQRYLGGSGLSRMAAVPTLALICSLASTPASITSSPRLGVEATTKTTYNGLLPS